MNGPFGDEYPAAVTFKGVRMPLADERRWTRVYTRPDGKMGTQVSRFMDGSAAISFPELAREWPTWSETDRRDFCGGCSWLRQQSDFPDMLRHLMRHGGPNEWASIASSVGQHLPSDEAFEFLTRVLRSTEIPQATNIAQGIALTKHPDAERILRAHLAEIWSHPSLWDDHEFLNWLAYGATCCIEHLIGLGAPPQDFVEQVRALAAHPCARNRDACRNRFSKSFPCLNDSSTANGDA